MPKAVDHEPPEDDKEPITPPQPPKKLLKVQGQLGRFNFFFSSIF